MSDNILISRRTSRAVFQVWQRTSACAGFAGWQEVDGFAPAVAGILGFRRSRSASDYRNRMYVTANLVDLTGAVLAQ
jgi:hypothetical protein